MASTKLILRTDKMNSQEESPLFLRITKHRKSHYVSLGIYLKEKEWDASTSRVRKSRQNSGRLNAFLAKKVADAENIILDTETHKTFISSTQLRKQVKGIEPVDFFVYSNRYLESLWSGQQIATYKRASAVIAKLKLYRKNKPLYLDEITHSFLQDYENYLKRKFHNKLNTIHGNHRIIRKILNDAIVDKLLPRDDNPFITFKLKVEPSKRTFLTEDEITAIEKLDLSGKPGLAKARDTYLFATWSGGKRISDVLMLKWKNIADGRVFNEVKKTKKMHVIKLPDKALHILEQYKTPDSKPNDFIFGYFSSDEEVDTPLKLHEQTVRRTSFINNKLQKIAILAGIEKKLTTHISRHTFATLALRKGIRIEYVSKLLGHADLKETQIYAKIVDEELDKAMDVFND